jgi:peptidoglycan pentaglycine glycine transferase (the first glycine)
MITPGSDSTTWNKLIAPLPGAHILQTWEWGLVKEHNGWQPVYCLWLDDGKALSSLCGQWSVVKKQVSQLQDQSTIVGAAMVLRRAIPVGGFAARMRVLYIPKGPLLDWANTSLRQRVLHDLHTLARKQGGIFIKIDPDVPSGTGIPGTQDEITSPTGQHVIADLRARGWHFSDEQVQFRNTVSIDLTQSEDDLLANMKQKTRYNIRLAMRKGVMVRAGNKTDLNLLYRMYAETSIRDGFVIRDESYYRAVWETFLRAEDSSTIGQPGVEILVAEVDRQPTAAVLIFHFAGKAWYLYGMSNESHREKMPNHLLQWEAMRRARAVGCTTYDLWGAPDNFEENDPLWGVFRFKEGFGGKVVRYIGAWDLPVNPLLYRLYTQVIPRILSSMRKRGKVQTKNILG